MLDGKHLLKYLFVIVLNLFSQFNRLNQSNHFKPLKPMTKPRVSEKMLANAKLAMEQAYRELEEVTEFSMNLQEFGVSSQGLGPKMHHKKRAYEKAKSYYEMMLRDYNAQ